MRKEDIASVMNIERLSFSAPWSETAFLGEIGREDSLALIAVMHGKTAGYLCARRVLDEGHILNLAVHPNMRRKGIGGSLAGEAFKRLTQSGCMVFYLEVRVSNAPAIRFYERLGFSVVGKRKKYYRSPTEDAALMIRME